MCCCFAAAFPQDLHQGQRQLLTDGVLENRGDFLLPSAGTPKQGENCRLARPTRTSWLPYQLEIPVDFSEVGMPVGKRGGGWEKEALAAQSLKIWKVEANTLAGGEEVTSYAGSPSPLAGLPGGFPAP